MYLKYVFNSTPIFRLSDLFYYLKVIKTRRQRLDVVEPFCFGTKIETKQARVIEFLVCFLIFNYFFISKRNLMSNKLHVNRNLKILFRQTNRI